MNLEYGEFGQKFLVIIEIDGEQVSIYCDDKRDLKKKAKDITKNRSHVEIYGVEYWKNKQDEYLACDMGNNSMISLSQWFDNLNFKLNNN